MGLVIFLIILGVCISYVIAEEFSTIAMSKGYNDRKYFWYCFLLGIVGYLMVVALPIKKGESSASSHKQIDEQVCATKQENKMVGNFPAIEFSEDSGIKQCPSCGTCHDSNLNLCPACKHQYT